MDATFIVGAAIAALAVGALYIAARRAITVADLEITSGVLRVVRGGIAPPILSDLRDIAKHPPIKSATIRITRSSGRAEVTITGEVSAPQAQRIRNVIGSVPLARLSNTVHRK
jgi:hypothetical protein